MKKEGNRMFLLFIFIIFVFNIIFFVLKKGFRCLVSQICNLFVISFIFFSDFALRLTELSIVNY